MKKVLAFLISIISVFSIATNSFAAGGFSVSTGAISLYQGETSTFSVTASNSAGKLTISSTNPSVASVSTGAIFLDLDSQSITITAKSVGSAMINVVATNDYATYDEEILAGQTKTVSITVKEKPQPKPEQTSEPEKETNNNQENTNNNQNNSSNQKTEQKPSSSTNTTNKQNTNTNTSHHEENKESEGEKEEEHKSKNTKLKELSIRGFELEKIDDETFALDVSYSTIEIEINAEAESSKAEVSGTGKKKLETGENTFEIIVKAEDGSEKTYKLIVYKAKKATERSVAEDEEEENNSGIIIAIIIAVLLVGAGAIFFILKKKKTKNTIKEPKNNSTL